MIINEKYSKRRENWCGNKPTKRYFCITQAVSEPTNKEHVQGVALESTE